MVTQGKKASTSARLPNEPTPGWPILALCPGCFLVLSLLARSAAAAPAPTAMPWDDHFLTSSPAALLAAATAATATPTAGGEPPPVTVTVAGSGNDAFVFHPGFGADVIVHAASSDTFELDGFSSITSGKQLASLLAEAQAGQPQSVFHSANGGHDTVINLDNHDSITLTNVHLADLHASNFIIH